MHASAGEALVEYHARRGATRGRCRPTLEAEYLRYDATALRRYAVALLRTLSTSAILIDTISN